MPNTRFIVVFLSLIAIAACADDFTVEQSPEHQGGQQEPHPEEICVAPAPPPSDVEISYFDGERPDGAVFYGRSATSTLSTGDIGEVKIVVESDGTGEAYLAINGVIVSQAAISADEYIDEEPAPPAVHTWTRTDLHYSGELIAELLQGEIGDTVINGMFPQEFKCSSFGKKAVRAGKYMFMAAIGAAGAACSMGTGAVIPCMAAASAAGGIVGDRFEGYCD